MLKKNALTILVSKHFQCGLLFRCYTMLKLLSNRSCHPLRLVTSHCNMSNILILISKAIDAILLPFNI